jgi:hypothetical protein
MSSPAPSLIFTNLQVPEDVIGHIVNFLRLKEVAWFVVESAGLFAGQGRPTCLKINFNQLYLSHTPRTKSFLRAN